MLCVMDKIFLSCLSTWGLFLRLQCYKTHKFSMDLHSDLGKSFTFLFSFSFMNPNGRISICFHVESQKQCFLFNYSCKNFHTLMILGLQWAGAIIPLMTSGQKAEPSHLKLVGCSMLVSIRLGNYCHLASWCIFPYSSIQLFWQTYCLCHLNDGKNSHLYLLFLQDLQIISTDENQVFVAVQEWYQTDTYNLYQSDPQGIYYSILLENVRSTKQPEENVLIDILEVGF